MNSLIVGLGSANGPDQLGWLLIDKLEKTSLNSTSTFIKSNGSGTDWFHELHNSQNVIFLDAAFSHETPGNLLTLSYDELKSFTNPLSSTTHSISLLDSIDLAKNIGVLNIPVHVIAISIGPEYLPNKFDDNEKLNIHSVSQKITLFIKSLNKQLITAT